MGTSYEFLRQRVQGHVYRAGSDREYFSTLCPFHEDRTPSLMVYKAEPMDVDGRQHHGHWHCLACNKVGGLDALWRKLQGWTPPERDQTAEALEWRPPALPTDKEKQERLITTAHAILSQYKDRGWYLEQRGVQERIDPCVLGYYNGWITVPIFDEHGDYKGMVMRATPPIEQISQTRFHQPPKQGSLMYVPDWNLLRSAPKIAVVFGIFDALTMAELRIASVTTTAGNSFNPMWLEPYKGRKVYLIPDGKAHELPPILVLMRSLVSMGVNTQLLKLKYPEGIKDPNGFLERGRKADLVTQLGGVLL